MIHPEIIHSLVGHFIRFLQKNNLLLNIARKIFAVNDPFLEKKLMGLTFHNPIGVAAGFDKNGKMIDGLAAFGFGFIEIGTVTPLPQPGNPRPRLFRLKKDQALINRMGFNNHGVEIVKEAIKKRRPGIIVGGNIGKNKITPNDEAVNDYLKCFHALYDYVDYFVINVSSPNTPGLRELQEKEPLEKILTAIQKANAGRGNKPVLVKIAPDLSEEQLSDVADLVIKIRLNGVVAVNTTLSRDSLMTDPDKIKNAGEGGLSGKPLFSRAIVVVKFLREKLGHEYIIIGVGGVQNPEGAIQMLEAGADLIQLYTGFIYQGPGIAGVLNRRLIEYYKNSRYKSDIQKPI